jgi:hypothetical protein
VLRPFEERQYSKQWQFDIGLPGNSCILCSEDLEVRILDLPPNPKCLRSESDMQPSYNQSAKKRPEVQRVVSYEIVKAGKVPTSQHAFEHRAGILELRRDTVFRLNGAREICTNTRSRHQALPTYVAMF